MQPLWRTIARATYFEMFHLLHRRGGDTYDYGIMTAAIKLMLRPYHTSYLSKYHGHDDNERDKVIGEEIIKIAPRIFKYDRMTS